MSFTNSFVKSTPVLIFVHSYTHSIAAASQTDFQESKTAGQVLSRLVTCAKRPTLLSLAAGLGRVLPQLLGLLFKSNCSSPSDKLFRWERPDYPESAGEVQKYPVWVFTPSGAYDVLTRVHYKERLDAYCTLRTVNREFCEEATRFLLPVLWFVHPVQLYDFLKAWGHHTEHMRRVRCLRIDFPICSFDGQDDPSKMIALEHWTSHKHRITMPWYRLPGDHVLANKVTSYFCLLACIAANFVSFLYFWSF